MSTVISRLELDHPDLGAPGGLALHTAIADLYKKIGDNMADRYFPISNLNAAASVDCDHNYNTDLANLHIDIYGWNEGTELLTYLDETTTPKLSEIAVIAKVGDTKKQITVTNNSAGQVDLALVLSQEILFLREGDIKDIDIVSTPPEDGQSLVFETSSQKFKPGASGDSSFKFQKLTGTVLTIKKGYMGLSDGSEIYSSVDLSPDLATFIPGANGDYYGYFDRYLFPDYTTVNGRKLIAMTTAQLVFSTTTPDLIGLSRYVAIGKVQKSAGVFTNIETLAMRKHDIALGVDGSLLDSLEYTLIGAVGDAAQLNSGHVLGQSSFPSAAYAATSYYNMDSIADENVSLAHNFTNSANPVLFTSSGILNDANNAASFNGSNQYLYSTDIHFDPGNVDFTTAAWIKATNWQSGYQVIVCQWTSTGNYCYYLAITTTGIKLSSTVGGTTQETLDILLPGFTGWHHTCLRYLASTNTFDVFIDGVNCGTLKLSGPLHSAGASRSINIGRLPDGNQQYFTGLIDEFLFVNGTAFTDNDIMKIQAAKYAHNKGVASSSQDWKWWIKTSTDAERPLDYSPVISQTLNELFFDLSQESSTCYIARKFIYTGQSGLSKPARGQTLALTTNQLDAILPITHNCGSVPNLAFLVSDGTDYVPENANVFKVDGTQIKITGDSLVTLFGTGINVILSYSSGVPSVFVPNKMWNKVVASSAIALSVNDRVFADTTSAIFTGTLPVSPSINDEIQVCDAKGNFGVNAFTFGRNGQNIMGIAADFDCDVSHKCYRAVYVDATYGWAIYY
jgi:hypothetical protein